MKHNANTLYEQMWDLANYELHVAHFLIPLERGLLVHWFLYSAKYVADRHFHSIVYTWAIANFIMERANVYREMSTVHS